MVLHCIELPSIKTFLNSLNRTLLVPKLYISVSNMLFLVIVIRFFIHALCARGIVAVHMRIDKYSKELCRIFIKRRTLWSFKIKSNSAKLFFRLNQIVFRTTLKNVLKIIFFSLQIL